VHMYDKPITESQLHATLRDLKIKALPKYDAECLVFYEREEDKGKLNLAHCESYLTNSFESAMVCISRRNVRNLLLVGLDMHGQNIKLLRELTQVKPKVYQQLYIAYTRPFKTIRDELYQLDKHHRVIDTNKLAAANSFTDLIE